jgi:hypothetical protein
MATRVSIDGTDAGVYTVRDLRVFLETWQHLGMPDDAKIHAVTKITGKGSLKTLTAEYDTTADVPAQPQSSAKPYIPGLSNDSRPTAPMPAVPPGDPTIQQPGA